MEKGKNCHLTLWLGYKEMGILDRRSNGYRSRSDIIRESVRLIKLSRKGLLKVQERDGENEPPKQTLQTNLLREEYEWLRGESEKRGISISQIISGGLHLFDYVEASL